MSVRVILRAKNFSDITTNLRKKLSQTKKLRGVKIEETVITFYDSDNDTITVHTKGAIDRQELIGFLCSLQDTSFGSSEWLSARSEHFQSILAINVDDNSATVNLEFSK